MVAHKKPQPSISAASIKDVRRDSGDWVFVDIGFAQKDNKSCGFARNSSVPKVVNFANLVQRVCESVNDGRGPLNLLIEAPLSVAFDSEGNPTGRKIERRESNTRYWYVGLGCSVLLAATHLLFRIRQSGLTRQVRLVEGFASFKTPSNAGSSHLEDVCRLRSLAWKHDDTLGCVIAPDDLKAKDEDDLRSAFEVSGMDFGVPPVVMLS